MFQLLQPIWLWAISGVIIPVIVHLWNIREGKIVKVGSISLLQESARQQARSLKLKDLLLLLLRCLLIVALAFLLAKPAWQKQLNAGGEKGWVLIEKSGVKNAYQQHKDIIDSLQSAGFKFHSFEEGFPAYDWQAALKKQVDTTTITNLSYWILIKQLNELIPSDLPVFLFTTNALKRFSGPRPEVAMNLKWLTYSSPDTMIKQPLAVYKTPSDSLRLLVANNTLKATYYISENVVEKNLTPAMKLDTAAINIAIYTDNFATDASYLKAAIDAIEQTADIKINTVFVKNESELNEKADWLFWLSEKPLPQSVPPNVFLYDKGKEQFLTSFVYSSKRNSISGEPVHLLRSVPVKPGANKMLIWKDGYGNSVLSVSRGNHNRYHFSNRFNPAWSDLPWSGSFVTMIYDLLIQKNKVSNENDKRMIDAGQMQPLFQKSKEFDKKKFIETIDLTKWLWAIAFLLFFLERYISLTKKSEMYA